MSVRAPDCWWKPHGRFGAAAVIHVDLTPHPAHEASAFAMLDPCERKRWRRFVHLGARRRFALCRAALRAILCDRLGCRNEQLAFGQAIHEKPFALVDGEHVAISFNVSHGGRHGLIALAPDGRLGVDVEERTERRDFDRLIDAAFGANEQRALTRANGPSRIHLFFKLWTIKEALIKALGTGMSFDPADFEAPAAMRLGASSATYRFPQLPTMNWRVDDLGCDEFAAAVAHEPEPRFSALTDAEIDRALARAKGERA